MQKLFCWANSTKKSFNDFFLTSAKHRPNNQKVRGPSIFNRRLTWASGVEVGPTEKL